MTILKEKIYSIFSFLIFLSFLARCLIILKQDSHIKFEFSWLLVFTSCEFQFSRGFLFLIFSFVF